MSLVSTDAKITTVLKDLHRRQLAPCKKYVDEVIALHKRLPRLASHGRRIAVAQVQITADRNRIVQMKAVCLRELQELRDVRGSLTDYITVRYHNFLDQYKNKPARDAVINDALLPLSHRIKPLENTLEIMDVILADYDKAAYAVKDICSALALGQRE